MAEKQTLRALVVDDELAMQKLLLRALRQQGFECEAAADGNEAEQKVMSSHFDAVVTDLKMPNKHGHALATFLLGREQRPVIVVHTGVIEPKLAKDLLARGVDDIVFKPCDFSILAAKVKALVARRDHSAILQENQTSLTALPPVKQEDASIALGAVASSELDEKLSDLSRILPISKTALEIYTLTSSGQAEVMQIADVIRRDATLTTDVLRIANCSCYSPNGQRTIELEQAIIKIGQKCVGDLALASNTLAALWVSRARMNPAKRTGSGQRCWTEPRRR